MIQFLPLERESQDPGFQKESLKHVDEDPTGVKPNEMKNSSPSFRAIVTLFKQISDEYMIARPAAAISPSHAVQLP